VKTAKLLLVISLIIVLSLASLVWFFPSNGDFRVENPFWNGLSSLSSKSNAIAINSFSDLPADAVGTSFFLVPYEPLSSVEFSELESYVSSGGTLVVLDDYGFGNQVLDGLGLSLRFACKPLLDPLFDYKDKWLPKIVDFASDPLATNVSSLVFNHASCLNDTAGVSVVANSSKFSFLDLNGNGAWDSGEPIGPLPVVAYASLGRGFVVTVADPSLLINDMIGMGDNLRFVDNIVSLHGGGGWTVFVDQGHLPGAALDGAKAFLASVYGFVALPIVALSLIAVILVLSLKPIWGSGGKFGDKH
jgi:hypothetical protein